MPCCRQHMEAVLDFRSRIWVTYRRVFPEIGAILHVARQRCTAVLGCFTQCSGVLRSAQDAVVTNVRRVVRLDIGCWVGLHPAERADAFG